MAKSEDPALPAAPEALRPLPDSIPESVPVHPVHLQPSDPTPTSLGVLPLRDLVLMPGMVTPIVVVRPPAIAVVKRAARLGTPICFVTQRNAEMHEPDRDDLYDVGTVGRLLRVLRFSDGSMRALVEGLRRARVGEYMLTRPVVRCRVIPLEEMREDTVEAEAMADATREEFTEFYRGST